MCCALRSICEDAWPTNLGDLTRQNRSAGRARTVEFLSHLPSFLSLGFGAAFAWLVFISGTQQEISELRSLHSYASRDVATGHAAYSQKGRQSTWNSRGAAACSTCRQLLAQTRYTQQPCRGLSPVLCAVARVVVSQVTSYGLVEKGGKCFGRGECLRDCDGAFTCASTGLQHVAGARTSREGPPDRLARAL